MERVEQVVRLHLTPSRLHTEPLINQMKAWEAGAARHADCLWEPVPRGRTDKWWFHVQVLMRSLTCEMINSNVIFTEKTESTHEGSRLEKTVCLVGKFLFLCPSLVIICFKNWTRIYIYSKNAAHFEGRCSWTLQSSFVPQKVERLLNCWGFN